MAIRYSKTVMDHFSKPRNVGELDDADGIGEVGNPACGDIMTFYIKVQNDRIQDVKFNTFGCGAAIAVSSMLSEMAKGKTLDVALEISNRDVAEQLEGLPTSKMHCSNLGADALHAAIHSYREKVATGAMTAEKVVIDNGDHDHDHDHDADGSCRPPTAIEPFKTCRCPMCDVETPADKPFCQACGRNIKEEN